MLHILVDRSDETVRTPLEPLKFGGDFNHKFWFLRQNGICRVFAKFDERGFTIKLDVTYTVFVRRYNYLRLI